MTYRIFIDGAAGTTGLQVNERLAAHPSVTPVTLDDAQRKDAAARREMMAASDITILCLPDDAARESAALAAEVGARVIDASTAHRTAEGWISALSSCSRAHAMLSLIRHVSATPDAIRPGSLRCHARWWRPGSLPPTRA